MTSESQETIVCGCCGKRSDHWVLLSTNSSGSADLDQRPPEMERDTMEMWLQECPSCGYVAPSIDQGDEIDRANAASPEYRALVSGSFPSSLERRFRLRAGLVAQRGDAESAFSNALCAAWAADDHGTPERASEHRIKAASYVCGRAGVSLDTRLRLLDVLRRSSRWEAADGLASELKSEELEYPFDAIIDFHLDKIAQRDGGCYTIEEALAR